MKKSPQASVLFLSCDQGEFVRAAIHSILAQQGIVLEILVSDDASRDESYRILQREIAAYRGPHTVILERNDTRVGHENVYRLAMKASCDFQIQAHSDDVSHPERCLKLWEAHKATGASVVTSNYEHLDVWGNSTQADAKGESRFHPAQEIFETLHSAGVFGACLSWHREIFIRFPVLEQGYLNTCRDCLCAMRGSLLGGTYFLSEPLLKYRHHPAQNSLFTRWKPRFRDVLAQENKMVWREAVLRDFEWALENEKDEAKREHFKILYEQFSLLFLELARQQYCKQNDMLAEGFNLNMVSSNQLSPLYYRVLKAIPSGKARRLVFLPREIKRQLTSRL